LAALFAGFDGFAAGNFRDLVAFEAVFAAGLAFFFGATFAGFTTRLAAAAALATVRAGFAATFAALETALVRRPDAVAPVVRVSLAISELPLPRRSRRDPRPARQGAGL
jgi:hypothetical protein